MSKFIEILAMVLGGLSLFLVCFLGFAVLSGKPLSSLPVVGGWIEEPQEESTSVASGSEADGAEVSEAAQRAARAERSETEVVQASIGMMGAWSLPSPYSKTELKELVEEVKGRLKLVESRERDVEERERAVQVDERAVKDQFATLEELQQNLEEFGRELELREREVQTNEADRAERERMKWVKVAGVLGSLDPTEAGLRLVEYAPEEAAHILHAMPDEQAGEILNQVSQDWKAYVDAYTQLPESSRP